MYRTARVVLLLLFVAGWVPPVSAGIRPSFNLRHSAWHATHVVLATEGDRIDGVFEVIESWWGDLKKGDRITVPELADFAAAEKRTISPGFSAEKQADLPTHVTGARVALFLRRADEIKGAKPEEMRWAPTGIGSDMGVSVAWIERGRVFAFVQEINPGPSLLIPLNCYEGNDWVRLSEEKMKAVVLRFGRTRLDLDQAMTLPSYAERVARLEPLARSDELYVCWDALKALGSCGEPALPVLRKLLRDSALDRQQGSVIGALAQAAGAKAGPEMTAILDEELAFWKKTGPTLAKGWWGSERLSNRFGRTSHALYQLEKAPFPGCRKVVTEMRDLWRSLPHLEEIGNGQISQACDTVLQKLGE